MKQTEPRVGVGAILLNKNNQVLLVLRKKAPDADHWSLPGGKVDLYETIELATIREIREELNVSIELIQLVCVTNHILETEKTHFICPTFLAVITAGDLQNNEPDKLAEFGWFPLDQLPHPLTYTTTNALEALGSAKRKTAN
ncbi:NUDIX domain-containing protein [Vagococcus sp. BWB3-3]|uniref:NUDIX domain-containing protein n=1 Tax=Vagococcus allomyrinae TaxID=2794353 RepID=A0A940PBG2_9ENTE|nr:NUDIX domain-containing protein [Vagococcus allomyrinae]MBP1043066.1 NUDIX domain-containing protein [Vagococcus allomyrinae]